MDFVRAGLLGLLLAAPLSAAPGQPTAPGTRQFAGHVAEWDAKGRSLVLAVPGSRKHPHPKITWDADTRWAGLATRSHAARPGAPARVTVIARPSGVFYATRIDILAPEPPPSASGAAKMH